MRAAEVQVFGVLILIVIAMITITMTYTWLSPMDNLKEVFQFIIVEVIKIVHVIQTLVLNVHKKATWREIVQTRTREEALLEVKVALIVAKMVIFLVIAHNLKRKEVIEVVDKVEAQTLSVTGVIRWVIFLETVQIKIVSKTVAALNVSAETMAIL